jgi:pyruvate formate lyase activating enzyme
MEDGSARGTIFDIQRFTVHDGPGIRTAVFMKGCPLRCPWCQNPESIRREPQISYFPALCIGCANCVKRCPHKALRSSGKNLVEKINLTLCDHCGLCAQACNAGALRMIGRTVSAEEVCDTVMQDVLFYQNSGGGVTFTGGEPTYQPEFLTALAKACKKQGLHLVIETCGFFSWDTVAEALALIDIVYLDIKHIDSEIHQAVTGEGNAVILENARRFDKLQKPIRIRVPLIPGFNDSIETFGATVRFAAGLNNLERIQVLPYHRFGIAKFERIGWGYSLTGLETPPASTVEKLLALAERHKVKCTL